MIDLRQIKNIYLIPGYTNMRKQVDGLVAIVNVFHQEIELKTNNLYIFCGKSRVVIKILEIDDTGIWVYYKRTNGDKFLWPKDSEHVLITEKQLLWLLEGLNIIQKTAHKKSMYIY